MISGKLEGYFGRFWQHGIDNSTMDLMVRGWLDGCPNPKRVAQVFTDEWAIHRYFECSLVSALILERAEKINPALAKKLSSPISRLSWEQPQGFDPEAVPSDYLATLHPGSTIWGYAASRVLIELFGRNPNLEINSVTAKIALRVVDHVLRESNNPLDFVVKLSEKVVLFGADPTAVLSHLLAVEHLDEGLYTGIKLTWKNMEKNAPTLRKHYLFLSPEQRAKAGILPENLL